jgi:phospholipase/carboxylesterase
MIAAVSLTLLACEPSPTAPARGTAATATSPAPAPQPSRAAGLFYIEHHTAGASPSDRLPMIVAMHGLGDTAASFVALFRGFDVPARIVALQAPTPFGDGWAWFEFRKSGVDEEGLARGLESASRAVAASMAELTSTRPTFGKPIVTGFSQGGMMSFALAVRHPQAISGAYPVAGLLPEPLLTAAAKPAVPGPAVVALHGDADQRVPFDRGHATVRRLQDVGFDAKYESFPGVPHTVSPEMRTRLFQLLRDACARQRTNVAP